MIHHIAKSIELAAAIGAICGIAYNLLCVWSAATFVRQQESADEGARPTQPPVSILKPLRGTDPEMYESFRSHCLQDYPEYEIIFGVSDANDSAIRQVERLKTEFPQRAIRLLVCPANLGANTKVSNLAQMARAARYEHFVVNDSDIRVGPHYLRNIVAPLYDTGVGLVTCLYRGVPASTLGSRLESVGISTDFGPGVLTARFLEKGIRFGLGSTLAFRRNDLKVIGGFESFADYLADDYELGRRIAGLGLSVELSKEIVETFLPAYKFSEFLCHQLRWARTIRASRFWGFLGLIFTYALPWAVLVILASEGAAWAWGLFAATCCVRLLAASFVGRIVLNDRRLPSLILLIPLRDFVAPFVWFASFAGGQIVWRGDHFQLKDGRLVILNKKQSHSAESS
jgi:ceramide glucosyltransferase